MAIVYHHQPLSQLRREGEGVRGIFTPGERMSGFLAASVFMLCQDKLCQEAKLRQVDWVLLIGSCFYYIP